MTLRIALLTSTFPLNREEQDQAFWILETIASLRAAGHFVAVYTQDRPGVQESIEDVAVERFPWPSRNKRLSELNLIDPRDLWAAARLLANGSSRLPDFLTRHRIDLCLVFWALPSGWFAYRTLNRTGVPYRVWALGSDINKYGRLPIAHGVLRRILGSAQVVFADSFELARRIEADFAAPCEFLATTRTLSTEIAEPSAPDPRYTFLYVGRLAAVKGIDVLLRAAQELPDNCRLLVAGAGPLDGDVRAAAMAAGERILMLGRISDTELARELRACDCVVIPSRSETIPIVLNEALQFGKRLIVTDVGDMGYLVREYLLGEVVPPCDPEALAQAMARASSGVELATYDPGGWKAAKELFDLEITIAKLAGPR